VLDRLAGVGQVLADALAALRNGAAETAAASAGEPYEPQLPADDPEAPSAKVYFVEFPPAAAPPPDDATDADATDIKRRRHRRRHRDRPQRPRRRQPLQRRRRALRVGTPVELPTWWTRDGAQG